MTPVEFVRLTSRETGGELFLRRDMIAAVCSGYKGVTHVTLVNEDIDFEVKESVMETLRLVAGETYANTPCPQNASKTHGSLTPDNPYGIMRGRRRNYAQEHRKDKREIPTGSREAPAAVPPMVHDAP